MIEFERPKPLSNSLSITPLVDIIFLLLLFFLLTSVFITPGILLDLPEAATAEFQEQPTQEVVYISRLGEIYWNDRFMSIDDLSQALSQALQQRTDRQVTIKADKEVAFGLFVRVMDLVKAAGGEDLVISAEFPE